VINQIWNLEVFRSKRFNFFPLCRGTSCICENVFHFFTLTSRNPPHSFRIVWEWYLRKIPVLRLNSPRHSAREIVRLSTGIFRKYPTQTWYICSKAFAGGDFEQIYHVWERYFAKNTSRETKNVPRRMAREI
jgi:hypothetical protein